MFFPDWDMKKLGFFKIQKKNENTNSFILQRRDFILLLTSIFQFFGKKFSILISVRHTNSPQLLLPKIPIANKVERMFKNNKKIQSLRACSLL